MLGFSKLLFDFFQTAQPGSTMNTSQSDSSDTSLYEIDISLSEIRENSELQPRLRINEEHVLALASRFEKAGQLNAILVRPLEDASDFKYEIIGGSHRFRAADLLGWETIRCNIQKVSFVEAQILAIDDNDSNLPTSDYERALTYQRLLDSHAAPSQNSLADLLGISKGRISQCLSFLKLPRKIQEILNMNPDLFSYRVAVNLNSIISKHSDKDGNVDPEVLAVITTGLERLQNGAPVSGLLAWIKQQLNPAKPVKPATPPLQVLSAKGETLFKVKNKEKSILIEWDDLGNYSPQDVQKAVLEVLNKLV